MFCTNFKQQNTKIRYRLRKALKIVQGDRKRFVKKEITLEILENAAKSNPAAIAEAQHLQVNKNRLKKHVDLFFFIKKL